VLRSVHNDARRRKRLSGAGGHESDKRSGKRPGAVYRTSGKRFFEIVFKKKKKRNRYTTVSVLRPRGPVSLSSTACCMDLPTGRRGTAASARLCGTHDRAARWASLDALHAHAAGSCRGHGECIIVSVSTHSSRDCVRPVRFLRYVVPSVPGHERLLRAGLYRQGARSSDRSPRVLLRRFAGSKSLRAFRRTRSAWNCGKTVNVHQGLAFQKIVFITRTGRTCPRTETRRGNRPGGIVRCRV